MHSELNSPNFNQLDEFQQELATLSYESKKKEASKGWIYFLLAGAHYGYLGQWRKQNMLWVLMLLGPGLIWWLWDITRLKQMIENYNTQLAQTVIEEVQLETSPIITNSKTDTKKPSSPMPNVKTDESNHSDW